jgi:UDP-3-O-[3-hydroxymyristoyl] glucosamine N-acyltransferase
MKLLKVYSLKEIAALINAEYVGDENFPVHGFNEIHMVEEGDIVFVDHPKYYDKALNSNATIILINKKVDCPKGKALLISEDPFTDFNKLTRHFKPFQKATSSISESAKINPSTIVQPNCFIGNHVEIGENCVIHSNVSIYDGCKIGNNVIIHAGAVLGGDAFYYKRRTEYHDKFLCSGSVVIEDDVEIGSLTSIDKGVSGNTTIGKGTKIDSKVHIGHDTQIGKMCIIASQTGVAGCVIVKDRVTMWGQVGVTSGITIGEGAVIQAQSGVSKSLEGGKTYFGTPAIEARKKMKELATIRLLTSEKEKSS